MNISETDGTTSPDLRRLITRWHQRLNQPPGRSHRIGAEWRDTTYRLRAEFATYALLRAGEFHGLTLNLREDVEVQARMKGPKAKRYLTERLSRQLDAVLGRKIAFWFELEESTLPARRLHLHGAIGCTSGERKKARAALRRAGGVWELSARKYQALLQQKPDDGLVSYAFKDPWFIKDQLYNKTGRPSWGDEPFMITLGLKREAEELYKSARVSVRLTTPGIAKLAREATDH